MRRRAASAASRGVRFTGLVRKGSRAGSLARTLMAASNESVSRSHKLKNKTGTKSRDRGQECPSDGGIPKGYSIHMITVLVRVTHGPEALAATLGALVPAVAAGLIGDAVILTEKPDDTLAKV